MPRANQTGKYTVFLSLLAAAVLVSPPLAGEELPVKASVSVVPPTGPYVHPFSYCIQLEGENLPELKAPDLEHLPPECDVLETKAEFKPLEGQKRGVWVFTYTLDPLRPGTYVIPPQKIALTADQSIDLPSVAYEARDLTESERQALAELKDILPLELAPSRAYLLWAALGLFGLLLVAGAAVLYLRRKTNVSAMPEVILSPWERAQQRLKALAEKGYVETGDHEAYYVELSAIVRQYLEERFGIRAPELTTQEFIHEASSNALLKEEHRAFLIEFLKHSDYVKFARYAPTPEQMQRVFGLVERFINETIPRENLSAEQAA